MPPPQTIHRRHLYGYDPATDTWLPVTTNANGELVVGGITIDATVDKVRLWDGTNILVVNPDGSINVNTTFPAGFDVNNFPSGFDVNNFPAGFDVDNFPAGFDVNNFPAGFNVDNFPAGFDVNNFPAGFDVNNFPEGFDVNNFPAAFKIWDGTNFVVVGADGSLRIGNFPAGFDVNNFPTAFDVSNFPSGFDVNNFPAVQVVSGTVGVNNFPADYPNTVIKNKFDIASPVSLDKSASGDTAVIAPGPGKRLRIKKSYAQAAGALGNGLVEVKWRFGTGSYFNHVELTGSQPWLTGMVYVGAVDEAYKVNTNSSARVLVNVDYEEF